jgi:TatD DNase family protein
MLPMLTDSHCHLEAKDFKREDGSDEREDIIARARAAGVTHMICVGSGASHAEIDNAIAMAETHPDIWAAVGIHPHDVARMPADALAKVERLAATHPRVVAVGETGLDYYYDHSPRDTQREVFAAFLDIARRTAKPVSLHIRDAHDDALAILAKNPVPGVVHCFTGNRPQAEAYVALGLSISFSGIVTFKSASEIRDAASVVPLDKILVETDCPYLAPVPMRGKRNEPAWVAHTARFVADLRGVPLADFAQLTSQNASKLFGLPSLDKNSKTD